MYQEELLTLLQNKDVIMAIAVLVYFLLINFITFVVYGIDKKKAKRQQWRISEKTLIILAIIGGSLGAVAGMKTFRHKTKHKKFYIGIPIIIIIQIGIIGIGIGLRFF